MAAEERALVLMVPGRSSDHDLEIRRTLAARHLGRIGFASHTPISPEDFKFAGLWQSAKFSTILLLTSGEESAIRGMLVLESLGKLPVETVDWIDSTHDEVVIRLRRLEKPGNRRNSGKSVGAKAARAFVQGRTTLEAPIGYLNNTKAGLRPGDPMDCELVRFIFQTYCENELSRSEISHLLNAQQIPVRRDVRAWDARMLLSILTDVRYAGSIRLRAWIRDHCHPPLITRKQLEMAHSILKGHLAANTRAHFRPARGFPVAKVPG